MLQRWEYIMHIMARHSVSIWETLFIKCGIMADDGFVHGGVPKSIGLCPWLITYEDHWPCMRFEFGVSMRRAMDIGSTPKHMEVGDIGCEGHVPHRKGCLPGEPTH